MNEPVAPSLVGRSDELSALVDAVLGDDRGHRGDVATVLVGGDAGVGKSRLIEELTSTLRARGVAVAVGSCVHIAHSSLPFAAVTEAMSQLRHHVDLADLHDELGGGAALDRLVPDDLGGGTPDVRDDRVPIEGRSQLWMFEAIRRLIEHAAVPQRVCVVLEDLHWADASTRDLIGYLATNIEGGRATIVGTYRTDDLSRTHPFRPVLAELTRNPRVDHVALQPFDREELTAFATGHLGRPPSSRVLDELLERSGGNAFFAAELLDAIGLGDVQVRPEVTELVLGRIERVSEPTRAVLRLLAVGGQAVPDELLGIVSDESDEVLDEALREAVEHQLLVVVDGDQLRFRHALMQEVVHSTLLPRERRRTHARFAAALLEAPRLAACSGRHHAELAWHHREAGQLRESLLASIRAADDALEVVGLAEALEHLVAATEVWDDVDDPEQATGTTLRDLLCRAAEVAYRLGDIRVVQLQEAAIRESSGASESELGPMYERLGRFLWNMGRQDSAEVAYRRAAELVPPTPPTEERALVLAGLGQMLMIRVDIDEAEHALTEALDVARAVGARRIEGHALNSIGSVLLHSGRYDAGVAMLEQAIEIARELDAFEDLFRAHVNLGDAFLMMGDLDSAERVSRVGVRLAEEVGDSYAFFIGSNLRAVLVDAGRWDEALELHRSGRRPDGALADIWDRGFLPQLEMRRGNLA